VDTFTIILLIIGFPVALIFTWAFELTPEGIKSTITISPTDKPSSTVQESTTPEKTTPTTEDPSTLTPLPKEQSIAVLPFVNMSSDPEQEYFSNGIAEELLNQLTKLRGLHVAGRTSSFYFKNKHEDLRVIGEKLNVAHILEGSVRKAGSRVRITTQLIKVADGYHLWSESYDRDLNDIFAIQEETAKAVADALSITLGVGKGDLGVGGTRHFAAYDAYLAGLSLYNQFGRESISRAIEQLEKAVALDPEFAHAWSALASTYDIAATSFISERAEEFIEKSDEAASRAIEIAPDAVASLYAEARLQIQHRDWTRGQSRHGKKHLSWLRRITGRIWGTAFFS